MSWICQLCSKECELNDFKYTRGSYEKKVHTACKVAALRQLELERTRRKMAKLRRRAKRWRAVKQFAVRVFEFF